MRQIAASPRVQRLLFGSIDFQVDLGIDGEGDELLFFRSQALRARVATRRLPGARRRRVHRDRQAPNAEADTLRGKRLGFGGELCIHPRQVPLVNARFAPSMEEITWAKRVLEAADKADGAAVAVDGRMVDRPVILKAERIALEAARTGGGLAV